MNKKEILRRLYRLASKFKKADRDVGGNAAIEEIYVELEEIAKEIEKDEYLGYTAREKGSEVYGFMRGLALSVGCNITAEAGQTMLMLADDIKEGLEAERRKA